MNTCCGTCSQPRFPYPARQGKAICQLQPKWFAQFRANPPLKSFDTKLFIVVDSRITHPSPLHSFSYSIIKSGKNINAAAVSLTSQSPDKTARLDSVSPESRYTVQSAIDSAPIFHNLSHDIPALQTDLQGKYPPFRET